MQLSKLKQNAFHKKAQHHQVAQCEQHCVTTTLVVSMRDRGGSMQDRLSGAASCQGPPSEPLQLQGEWASLQSRLAQTEAALRAEQHSCALLREQAEESRGCAVQAQVQLEISHSRAERLAALVNQANQQRKGYAQLTAFLDCRCTMCFVYAGCTCSKIQAVMSHVNLILASTVIMPQLQLSGWCSLTPEYTCMLYNSSLTMIA